MGGEGATLEPVCPASYGTCRNERACEIVGITLRPRAAEPTDIFPSGRRNRCPPPPLPRNSRPQTHAATHRHGDTVRVECELRFELRGPAEVRCDRGAWTEPPQCTG